MGKKEYFFVLSIFLFSHVANSMECFRNCLKHRNQDNSREKILQACGLSSNSSVASAHFSENERNFHCRLTNSTTDIVWDVESGNYQRGEFANTLFLGAHVLPACHHYYVISAARNWKASWNQNNMHRGIKLTRLTEKHADYKTFSQDQLTR